jgi:hypothetical protein
MKRLPAVLALVAVLMFGMAGMASATTLAFEFGDPSVSSTQVIETQYTPPSDSPIASVNFVNWHDDGGGHLYFVSFARDSIISFTTPTYVNSFQMNGMPNASLPQDPFTTVVFGPMKIEAFNAAGELVWSTTVTNLGDYADVTGEWLPVDVNTANISSIIFRAVNPLDLETYPSIGYDPNGPQFWASVDNLVINEAAAVPIPASVWLLGSGLLGLVGLRRKVSR